MIHQPRTAPVTVVIRQVLTGMRMRPPEQRVEIEIADDQWDAEWQLRDLDATLEPALAQLTAIDEAFHHALMDAENRTAT